MWHVQLFCREPEMECSRRRDLQSIVEYSDGNRSAADAIVPMTDCVRQAASRNATGGYNGSSSAIRLNPEPLRPRNWQIVAHKTLGTNEKPKRISMELSIIEELGLVSATKFCHPQWRHWGITSVDEKTVPAGSKYTIDDLGKDQGCLFASIRCFDGCRVYIAFHSVAMAYEGVQAA